MLRDFESVMILERYESKDEPCPQSNFKNIKMPWDEVVKELNADDRFLKSV